MDKVLISFAVVVVILLLFGGCIVLYVGANQWFLAQNEATYIANSMAMYGGYTNVLNQQVSDYCSKYKINPASVILTVTPSGSGSTPPAAYGQKVDVTLSYAYQMSYMGVSLPATITPTSASALCTYVQGIAPGGNLINVQYMEPSI